VRGTIPAVASPSSLLELLDLEVIEVGLFRGRSPETSQQRVFGGQVAAQALVAAGRTVPPDRRVHSLHAYFVRPGDPAVPILYQVDSIRDGRSFTTRRVVARQHGRSIFIMSASFQVEEPGLDHQAPAPDAPAPDALPTIAERLGVQPGAAASGQAHWQAIDVRYVGESPYLGKDGDAGRTRSQVWFRAAAPLPDEPLLHVCVLTYASDLTLLSAALVGHELSPVRGEVQMASLDHAMWFHRPFRADEWLLFDQGSPSASGGRGLATGSIFTAHGTLVASAVQEGLVRPVRPPLG